MTLESEIMGTFSYSFAYLSFKNYLQWTCIAFATRKKLINGNYLEIKVNEPD